MNQDNVTKIIIALIISITLIFCFLTQRYTIHTSDDAAAFQIDRLTGRTWFIYARNKTLHDEIDEK